MPIQMAKPQPNQGKGKKAAEKSKTGAVNGTGKDGVDDDTMDKAMEILEKSPNSDPIQVIKQLETDKSKDINRRNNNISRDTLRTASPSSVKITYEEPSVSTMTPEQLRLQNIQDIADVFPEYDRNKIYLLLEKHWDEADRLNTVIRVIYEELTVKSKTDILIPAPAPAVAKPTAHTKKSSTSTFTFAAPGPRRRSSATLIVDPLSNEAKLLAAMFPEVPVYEIYEYLVAHYDKMNRRSIVMTELKKLTQTEDKRERIYTESQEAVKGIIESVKKLEDCFPDADPNYLYEQVINNYQSKDIIKKVGEKIATRKAYPQKADVLKRDKLFSERDRLQRISLSPREFLRIIPDAETRYYNTKDAEPSGTYKEHCLEYLKQAFPGLSFDRIKKEHKSNKYRFTPTLRHLETLISQGQIQSIVTQVDLILPHLPDTSSEEFYLELYFTRIEDQIIERRKSIDKRKARRLAKCLEERTVMACALCMNDTVLPENMIACPEKHNFCTDCVTKFADHQVRNGRAEVECMLDTCNKKHPLPTLHSVLTPKAFMALLNSRVCEGINADPSDNLVSCPCCSYVTLASNKEKQKSIKCLNPLCLEETCLKCRRLHHAPLECSKSESVESRSNTRERLHIEESVSAALIRECWKCDTPFIKDGGCNFVTCTCEAFNCYVCKRRIDNYDHFGEEKDGRCPLFSDTELLHRENILEAEKEARYIYQNSKAFRKGDKYKHVDPTKPVNKAPIRNEKNKKNQNNHPWPGYGNDSKVCIIL